MIISTKNKGWPAVFNEIEDHAMSMDKKEHYLVVPELLVGSFKNFARSLVGAKPVPHITRIKQPFIIRMGRNKYDVIFSGDIKHKILLA